MKTIKVMPWLMASLLVVLLASCGPSYVSTGVGYGPRPYPYYGYNYNYGYRPYGYYRPPVVVAPRVVRPRYYSYGPGSVPRSYRGNPGARMGGGYGGGRTRGPR
jgi:hypothetical protein